MSSNKNKWNKLEKSITKNFSNALKETADFINYDIVSTYDLAIDMFYDDYDPRYYRRTGSLYKGRENYNDINSKYEAEQVGENKYLAGTTVNSSFIGRNPYRADLEWVFMRSFDEGIHGMTSREQRQWGKNRLKRKVPTGVTINGVKYRGKVTFSYNWYKGYRGKERRQYFWFKGKKYRTISNPINYINKFYNTMPITSPSPEKILRKKFNQYYKHRKVVESLLDNYLFGFNM